MTPTTVLLAACTEAWYVSPGNRNQATRPLETNPRRRCEALAATQFGVVHRDQVIALGISGSTLARMVAAGALILVCRCVYRYPWAPNTFEQRAFVAQLFAGPTSALSHTTAARLLGLDGDRRENVHVTTQVRRRSYPPPGTRVHRSPLHAVEIKRADPLVLTDVVRTLLDLGAVVNEEDVEIALDSAVRLGLSSSSYIARRLQRTPPQGRKGFGVLARIVAERGDVPATGSALETRLARLLRRYKLPSPVRQYVVEHNGAFVARPDFAYPHARLAIEAQSSTHHFGRQAWARDLNRSNHLVEIGWRVIYVTDADLRLRPRETADLIRRALAEAVPPLF